VFTRTLSLSWAGSVQSIPPHPISPRYILILFSYHCLGPTGLFPSSFFTKILYAFVFSPMHVTFRFYLILLDLIILIILGEEFIYGPFYFWQNKITDAWHQSPSLDTILSHFHQSLMLFLKSSSCYPTWYPSWYSKWTFAKKFPHHTLQAFLISNILAT
jgi:hypothetical protein